MTEIYIRKHCFALKNARFISLVGNISLWRFLPQNLRQANTSRCSNVFFCFFLVVLSLNLKSVDVKKQFQRALAGNIFCNIKTAVLHSERFFLWWGSSAVVVLHN